MPRLDYRGEAATVLLGPEGQLLLDLLVTEMNRLWAVVQQPGLTTEDVRRALQVARQRQVQGRQPGEDG